MTTRTRALCEPAYDRRLATVDKILKVEPHPDPETHSLELVWVRGWQVVCRKGEFKTGDQCVYCEIDSVLPERPEFEFLASKKYRIKTIKLRGALSQGICFPLSILPPKTYHEGEDVSALLGVEKYLSTQSPDIKTSKSRREPTFPPSIPMTREDRIQNVSNLLTGMEDRLVTITEKLDGTSCTFAILADDTFHVCSRRHDVDEKEDSGRLYWQMAHSLQIEDRMRTLSTPLALQGEIIGPKIQGNNYKLDRLQFRLFNVYWVHEARHASYPELLFVAQRLGLLPVPRIHLGTLAEEKLVSQQALLTFSDGKTQIINTCNKEPSREGLVVRTLFGNPRLSFKVISNKYLLNH